MKTLQSVVTLVLAASFACVGCGGVKGANSSSNSNSPSGSQGQGTSTVQFAIPIHQPGGQFAQGPQKSPHAGGAQVARSKPQFIDASANGDFVIFLDGQRILSANFTPQWNPDGTPVTGPGPSAPTTSTPDGGSISYTSNVTDTEIDVSVNLTTVAGVEHTFGVVQENGACIANTSGTTDWCLGNSGAINEGYIGVNNGYVLADGQTSFSLNPGNGNPGITLTLKGVLEAAYICTDASCDNSTISQNAAGAFEATAYPVDENGNPITSSAYSNAWWDIEELDNQKLVTITTVNPPPFGTPNIDASGWDHQDFTFTCNGTGNTTIGARLLPTDPSRGPVTGFAYSQNNYPQAGAVLGAIGSDLFFGNTLSVQCTSYGSVVITMN